MKRPKKKGEKEKKRSVNKQNPLRSDEKKNKITAWQVNFSLLPRINERTKQKSNKTVYKWCQKY